MKRTSNHSHADSRGVWRHWPWLGLVVVALGMVAGFLGYTPSMWAQDALLVLLIVSVFALRRDVVSVVLLVVVALLVDWYEILPTPKTVYQTALLGGLALLALLFVAERKTRPWRIPRPLDLALWGLFLLLGAAAIPRGFDIPIAPKLLLIGSVLYFLGIFVAAFVFWLLGTLIVREPTRLRQLVSLLAAFGAAVALHAILQEAGIFLLLTPQWAHYFAQPGINYYRIGGSHVRAASFIVAPDIAEGFFSAVVFLPLGLLVASRSWAARALYAGEIVVTLLALLFTFGPVGWLAVALGVLLFAALALRGRARLVLLGGLAASAVIALALLPHELNVLVAHATRKNELGVRTGIWLTTLHAIAAHPLLGLGLGQGLPWELRAQAYKAPTLSHMYPHPQNSFLELAGFAGLPVLLVLVAILARGVVGAARNYRLADDALKPVIAGGLATLAAFCVNAFSDITFTASVLVPFIYVLLGALASPALTQSLRASRVGGDARAFTPVRYGPEGTPVGAASGEIVAEPETLALLGRLQRQAQRHAGTFLRRYGFAPNAAWLANMAATPTAGAPENTSTPKPFPLDLTPGQALPIAAARAAGKARGVPEASILLTAQDALAAWNEYTHNGEPSLAERVVRAATTLAETQIALPGRGGGWLVPMPQSARGANAPCLSAGVQALALATLLRGFIISGDDRLRDAAERARETFRADVLDGGVVAPAGDRGTVFEGVAAYPATHALSDYLLALVCLGEDAFASTPSGAETLRHAHETLHSLLGEYDRGATTQNNLASSNIPSPREHASHATLLATFALATRCPTCAARAESWLATATAPSARFAVRLMRLRARVAAVPVGIMRRIVFPRSVVATPTTDVPTRVCVPITAYPVAGGMRAVLGGWRQAMDGLWQMEFLTRHIGPGGEGQTIRSFELKLRPFGRETSTPSQFPNVWFYVFAGFRGLRRALRRFPGYACILPQDGIWTAAFASVVGKLAGVPVVTVDHGNIYDLFDASFRRESIQLLRRFALPKRLVARARIVFYWPSLRALAKIGTRHSTAFLVASDDMADNYREQLGVPAYRISRFPFMIDTQRYSPEDVTADRAALRARFGLAEDAVVIAMVNRLHPMKGLDVALPALQQMMAQLPEDARARVRVLIAGDGPLRAEVEREVGERGLGEVVRLLGECTPDQVIDVLRASDLFLFTAVRSINSMAVLEAMATGCATVATASTRHISEYLASGGGVAVPVRDVAGLADGLVTLVTDDAGREAARARARAHVAQHHTAEAVRRVLLRATGYTPRWESELALRQAEPSYLAR